MPLTLAARLIIVVGGLISAAIVSAEPFTPNDPYFYSNNPVGFPGQWQLDKQTSGAVVDVNIRGAWNRGLTGAGVTIGIVDNGVEYTHPDLAPNYSAADSWDFYDNDAEPLPVTAESTDRHGTTMSGLAAARGGNGIGITGAAPNASLAVLRAVPPSGGWDFSNTTDNQRFIDALRYHSTGPTPTIDIKNLSWGESGRWVAFTHGADAYEQAVIESTAAGTIFVKAAMNNRLEAQNGPLNNEGDANKQLINHLAEVITVAAVNSQGRFAEYSNWGASLSAAVPSGETIWMGGVNLTTTDRSLTAGYNPINPSPTADKFPDQAYTSVSTGTSAAAPIMSGILALAKEANPSLTTRFAKHLLARTSRLIDPDDASPMGGWTTNSAGYHFNNNYGFGLVDADALTLAATQFVDVTPLVVATTGLMAVNTLLLENDPTGATRTFEIASGEPLEEVQVRLTLEKGNLRPLYGDIEAILTSPSGTSSLLMYRSKETSAIGGLSEPHPFSWTYTSNAFWGEDPAGTWTLALFDRETAFLQDNNQIRWESFEVTLRSGTLIPLATIPGDFNSDGTVDTADYVVWRKELGTTYTQSDYDVWRTHFGQTAAVGAARSPRRPQIPPRLGGPTVPEPTTLLLLSLAAFVPLRRVGSRTFRRSRLQLPRIDDLFPGHCRLGVTLASSCHKWALASVPR
jgi:subtilisin family serine protease